MSDSNGLYSLFSELKHLITLYKYEGFPRIRLRILLHRFTLVFDLPEIRRSNLSTHETEQNLNVFYG